MGIKNFFNLILKIVFISALIVFPFGQLFRIQLPNFPEIKLQPLDFLCFTFVFISFVKKLLLKEKFTPQLFSKPMVVFGELLILSLLVNAFRLPAKEILVAFLYLIRILFYFCFYYFLVDYLKEKKLPVLNYLILVGFVIAVLSLVQYIFLPNTVFLKYLGWDDHLFRAIGSFLDPSFTGILLVLGLIIWLTEILSQKKNFIYWLSGIAMISSLTLSFSRIAYLSLIASSIIIFLFKKKFKFLLFFLILFAALIILAPKPVGEGVNLSRSFSFFAKTDNYKQVITIIKDNVFFGVGFNAYRFTQLKYRFLPSASWELSNSGAGADNSFLFVFATTGIFGFLAFLFLWGKILWQSFRLSVKSNNALILFSSAFALVIASFSINALFYPWILFWLMVLLANFTVEN